MSRSIVLLVLLVGCGASPDPCDIDADGDGESVCGPDGTPATGDCDDADPARSHLLTEIAYDGVDNDCDGHLLLDVDGDAYPGIRQADLAAIAPTAPWPSGLTVVDSASTRTAMAPTTSTPTAMGGRWSPTKGRT